MNYEHIARALGGPAPEFWSEARHAVEPLSQRIVRSILEHLRHQRDYRRLLQLPDYLLEDVGLSREHVVAKIRLLPF